MAHTVGMPSVAARPEPAEYAPYYAKYIALIGEGDIVSVLESQARDTVALLQRLTDEQAGFAYEPGKWTVRQVIGHFIDTERVFAYRILRISRNDATPIEGFDQDAYVENSPFESYTVKDLISEFVAVRASTVLLLRKLESDAWTRRGVANGKEVTVRAIAYITAGHELHHRRIVEERYLRQ